MTNSFRDSVRVPVRQQQNHVSWGSQWVRRCACDQCLRLAWLTQRGQFVRQEGELTWAGACCILGCLKTAELRRAALRDRAGQSYSRVGPPGSTRDALRDPNDVAKAKFGTRRQCARWESRRKDAGWRASLRRRRLDCAAMSALSLVGHSSNCRGSRPAQRGRWWRHAGVWRRTFKTWWNLITYSPGSLTSRPSGVSRG